jgi:hypothetical protein
MAGKSTDEYRKQESKEEQPKSLTTVNSQSGITRTRRMKDLRTNKPERQFIDLLEHQELQVYRVTFSIDPSDYSSITDEIQAYGTLLKEEVEAKNG